MKLIHHSPLGALEIPEVLGAVEPGEPFEIADDLGENLLLQSAIFSPAPDETADVYDGLKVPDLKTIAANRRVDITGLTKRADIIAALSAADAEEAGQ